MQEREAAWAALHTPTTEPAELAQIAAAYPEFAEAIAAHPNVYPELRDWAVAQLPPGAVAPGEGATTAEPWQQSPRSKASGRVVASGIFIAISLLTVAGAVWWLMEPSPGNVMWLINLFGGINHETYFPTGLANFQLLLFVLAVIFAFIAVNLPGVSGGTRVGANIVCLLGSISQLSSCYWVLYWSMGKNGYEDQIGAALWVSQLLFGVGVVLLVIAWIIGAARHLAILALPAAWALGFGIASWSGSASSGYPTGVLYSSSWFWIVVILLAALALLVLLLGLLVPGRRLPVSTTQGNY